MFERAYRDIVHNDNYKKTVYLDLQGNKRYGFHHKITEKDVFLEEVEDGQDKTYEYYKKNVGGRVLYKHVLESLMQDIKELDQILSKKEKFYQHMSVYDKNMFIRTMFKYRAFNDWF